MSDPWASASISRGIYFINFRYCPLIQMFCGKMSDNLIVKTHYRTLRAIYDTQIRSHEELLHLSGKKKIHTQNLQILMVEVYKCLSNISPPFTWDCFKQKYTPYHLRNTQLLELSKCRTTTYGLNTRLFKGSLLWNITTTTFQVMSSKNPENVGKHSEECCQTFQGMQPNIPGNVLKHFGECCQTFQGMLPNIPGNVAKHSG